MQTSLQSTFHESVKPISWLIGKWVSSSGKGIYPTIQPFSYCEEIEFASLGQPLLNYKAHTWHPEKKSPMHLESGFLRIKPGTNQLAFMVAHNFGLTSLEEGEVVGTEISLKSSHISRMAFAKDPAVTKIERVIKLYNNELCQVVYMETEKTGLTEHLRIIYKKLSSEDV
uniref:THAP4-like heme-binding domain-containing protein n=1 Tax=Clastoptera arizonana TaxID=38151 RepID=A0A1B6DRQ0_9HEMI